jgi:hypothetical protein
VSPGFGPTEILYLYGYLISNDPTGLYLHKGVIENVSTSFILDGMPPFYGYKHTVECYSTAESAPSCTSILILENKMSNKHVFLSLLFAIK